jgi:hypothetical protein
MGGGAGLLPDVRVLPEGPAISATAGASTVKSRAPGGVCQPLDRPEAPERACLCAAPA